MTDFAKFRELLDASALAETKEEKDAATKALEKLDSWLF